MISAVAENGPAQFAITSYPAICDLTFSTEDNLKIFDSNSFLLAIATTSVERPANTGLSPLLTASATTNLPV